MNFFCKIFSKNPASEQKLDTTKQTLPNQKKVEIQVNKETKSDIYFLKCSGCKREYEIGKNAVAVCLEFQVPGANILVVYDKDTERVDLVAPIDPSNKGAFERAKPGWKTIQNSLANGQKRKWKCKLCNQVNKYPDLSLDNSNIESTENTFENGISVDDITFGNQVWMTKKLNVNKFCNGDIIPEAKTNKEWKKAGVNKQPAWCFYDNDSAYGPKCGKLYNWYAVNDSRVLAPLGWHIPTDAEWITLTDYLEHEVIADKIKIFFEGGKVSSYGTNKSGFSDLPFGIRYPSGQFYDAERRIGCWSSTEDDTDSAWTHILHYDNYTLGKLFSNKRAGLSVRCLRD